jgi:DNA-binding GntR family transcriptional regulator
MSTFDIMQVRRANRRGLPSEAADRIRDAIFAGVFPPGSPIREAELAESLTVSRGSVREGLAVLQREGLVQSAWHRGTKVIGLTVRDVEEVYSVRAALEGLATRSAAGNVDPLGSSSNSGQPSSVEPPSNSANASVARVTTAMTLVRMLA